MYDILDLELRKLLSTYILNNILDDNMDVNIKDIDKKCDNKLFNLMCNSDSSIIIQKLIEKG